MQKSMQLIKAYTSNCYRFMKVNGDPTLAAWLQFGMQETRRIIDKFPSVNNYVRRMTDPEQPDNVDNEIENSILKYRIRFLNNMKVTTPDMAVRNEYRRIDLEQPRQSTTPPRLPGDILEIGHNRRRNQDLDTSKIELINRRTGFLEKPELQSRSPRPMQ